MRGRAYRPELPGYLEDRLLMSGMVGSATDPVILSARRLVFVGRQIRQGFHIFGRDRDIPHLREDLYNVAVLIPFGRMDGLGVTMNRIVTQMGRDLTTHARGVIPSAQAAVLAATRGVVRSRVEAGDVIVK